MSTTVFIECVSCGAEQELSEYEIEETVAVGAAHRLGWSVVGAYGAKATRCRSCRRARRTDRKALEEGRIGKKAGGQITGRARQ